MITEGFGYTLTMSWSYGGQLYMQKCLDIGCHSLGDDLGYFSQPGYTYYSLGFPGAQLIKLNADGLGTGLAFTGKNDATNEVALLYKDITGKHWLINA